MLLPTSAWFISIEESFYDLLAAEKPPMVIGRFSQEEFRLKQIAFVESLKREVPYPWFLPTPLRTIDHPLIKKKKCKGLTRKGKPCKAMPVAASHGWCSSHLKKREDEDEEKNRWKQYRSLYAPPDEDTWNTHQWIVQRITIGIPKIHLETWRTSIYLGSGVAPISICELCGYRNGRIIEEPWPEVTHAIGTWRGGVESYPTVVWDDRPPPKCAALSQKIIDPLTDTIEKDNLH